MGNSAVTPTPTVSLSSAFDHFREIENTDDRCNAQSILNVLQIAQDQPRGWVKVPIIMRPEVVKYMRNHGVVLHDVCALPNDHTMRQAVVVV